MTESTTPTEQTPTEPVVEDDGGAAEVQDGTGTEGLYNLESIPEEIRAQVEPVFKEWEGNVTREFQKRAEAAQQWEPFAEMGLNEYDPESVAKLIAFGEIASDEDLFKEWVGNAARELGITGESAAGAPAAAGAAEGAVAAAATEAAAAGETLTPEKVQEIINAQFEQREQSAAEEKAQADRYAEAETFIRSELDDLKKNHGEFNEDIVLTLAQQYDGTDAVRLAHAAFMAEIGKAENGVIGQVSGAPATPVTGGKTDAGGKPAASFDEAGARLRERIRLAASQ